MIVSAERQGQRLDRVLEECLPGLGLRARRRMAEAGRVQVDGRQRRSAYKVRAGQRVDVDDGAADAAAEDALALGLVFRDQRYAVVHKPAGLHSAGLAGGGGLSAERLLPGLFADAQPLLLNRLDRDTSGLLLVGFSVEAERIFRQLERQGEVDKEYRAVVAGNPGSLVIRSRLDTADRKRTRVLAEDDADPARWTRVEPLECFFDGDGLDLFLVRVCIGRGARHQIRAHLAAQGHPLLGDTLYGGPCGRRLFLHHRKICFDHGDGRFEATAEPDWGGGATGAAPDSNGDA